MAVHANRLAKALEHAETAANRYADEMRARGWTEVTVTRTEEDGTPFSNGSWMRAPAIEWTVSGQRGAYLPDFLSVIWRVETDKQGDRQSRRRTKFYGSMYRSYAHKAQRLTARDGWSFL